MAVKHQEVAVLPESLAPDVLDKGGFILNCERFADHWKVRKGFGQVAQHDTTFAFGDVRFTRFLGATLLETDFGHEQVITVVLADVFTGGVFEGATQRSTGAFIDAYLVTIHDLTTSDSYEVMLHPQTAQQGIRNDQRHALYETDLDFNHEHYTSGEPRDFFFEELNDILYFGSPRAGVWAYRPATFAATPRTQQVDSVDNRDGHYQAYGEDALVIPVAAAPGLFSDAFAYLEAGEFPRPVDVVAINGRLVYAAGRSLYFSDIGRPTSIAADNFFPLPSEGEITALAQAGGNLVIFTAHETYHYGMPLAGVLVSGGRLVKVSDHVGCASPTALVRAEGTLFWVDRNGIYASQDGLDIQPLAAGFESFFRDQLTNPWTHYFQQAGATTLASVQPNTTYRYDDDGLTIAFDATRRLLFVCFPSQDAAFVLRDGKWSLWTFESSAAPASTVRALRNLQAVRILPAPSGNLYAVATERAFPLDDTLILGAPSTEAPTVDSFILLQYGRGGGIDRTVGTLSAREDRRRIAGKWYRQDGTQPTGMPAPTLDNNYFIGEPLPVPDGFVWPNNPGSLADVVLLPVEVSPFQNATVSPDTLRLRFRFDNTHWLPVLKGIADPEIDYLLPPERAEADPGFAPGAPVATSEVQLYDSATGLPSITGDEVRVAWDGNVAGYTGPHAPAMNLARFQRNRFIYIPMAYIGPAADDCLSMGIQGVLATIARTAVYSVNCGINVWQQAGRLALWHNDDDVVQPVDYLLKSDQVDGEGNVIKARTVYIKGASRGNATTQIQSTAVHGQLNVLFDSDYKGWAAQVVDHAAGGGIEIDENKTPLRSRFRNNAGTMVQLTFNQANLAWGNPAVAATGNCLIADEPVDTIAISDSVKGEHVSVMLFGHMRNIAEALSIQDARLSIVAVAQRRRTGR